MPATQPANPRFANGAEKQVWRALVDQLGDDGFVAAGQRVTDHLKDHEADFVVAIEGAGIVCIEVNGGEVWHDGISWRQYRGGREVDIDPVRQARDACYALRSFVESDPRWTQRRVRWDHGLFCRILNSPWNSPCLIAPDGRLSTGLSLGIWHPCSAMCLCSSN